MKIKTLFGVRKVTDEAGRELNLAYYLTEDTREKVQEGPLYGAGIVKRSREGEESEWLDGLSYLSSEVEELLSRMMRGAVTPISLAAVADDFIGDTARA